MNFKEYIGLAIKTESCDINEIYDRLGNENLVRMLHASLGMVTEVTEFFESLDKCDSINIKEEIGDLFWYIAVSFHAARKEFPDIVMPYDGLIWLGMDIDKTKKKLLSSISEFVDIIKRTIYYDAYCLESKKLEKVLMDIYKTAYWAIGVTGSGERDDVLKCNIEKLMKRYGEKFNSDGALNRDIKNELSQYESER
jgi:hypothetical protein